MSNKIKDWCAIIALSIPSCVITILHSGYPEISLTMIIPLFLGCIQKNIDAKAQTNCGQTPDRFTKALHCAAKALHVP